MRTNWLTKRLGSLCIIFIGKTPSRKSLIFWDINKTGKNTWISIRDLNNTVGKEVFDSCEYISDAGAALFDPVPKGTLLLSFKLTIGRLAFAGKNLYTNEAIAALLIKNVKELNKEYLYYYLTFFDWETATKGSSKVKGKTLNKKKLKELAITFPALREQKRIVAKLDELFEKLEKAKQNTEKNLENVREFIFSYSESFFYNTNNDWQTKYFSDTDLLQIIDGDRGKNYPKKSDFFEDNYCLFLNTKNVRPDGFNFDQNMFITKQKNDVLRKGKLQRGDVVMTTRGTIGNIGLYHKNVPFDVIRINSGMLIMRANKEILLPEYLFAFLGSGFMKAQIRKYVSGAAQPQLPIKTLVKLRLVFPNSLTEQKRIVKKLDQLSEQTKKLEEIYTKKLEDIEELKKSILQQAFSGKL